jgi:hypothetical protein
MAKGIVKHILRNFRYSPKPGFDPECKDQIYEQNAIFLGMPKGETWLMFEERA